MTNVAIAIRTVIIVAVLCSPAWAQIELSHLSKRSLVGATAPTIVSNGSRILIGEDSRLQEVPVAIVTMKTSLAEPSIFAVQGATISDLEPLGNEQWMLVGSGRYLVIATSGKIRKTLDVEIGKSPIPPPPDDIKDEYHVGKIAHVSAPSDPAMAKQVASWYSGGADLLFGQPALGDINTIRRDIDVKFANKVCRDKATCEHWERWRVAVQAAFTREQQARKIFTRQDWYGSLKEVAAALEQVK